MDIHLVINKYLEDKQELIDFVNDSYNVVDNQIFRWGFANIPQPTQEEIDAITVILQG